MTRAFQFLYSAPNSKAQRLGLLITLAIFTIFVSAGFVV